MADTGAPWNIPYVEPTDLVREYPAADEAQANAIAAGLTAAGNAGIGSNVVSTTKTDTFTTSSESFVDITGLSLSITPTSATSKILVLAQIVADSAANELLALNLVRNSTAIAQPVSSTAVDMTAGQVNLDNLTSTNIILFLDEPATTSATTYKIQIGVQGASRINQFSRNSGFVAVSTITAIEVAA